MVLSASLSLARMLQLPLLLATNWLQANPELLSSALASLRAAGYAVVTPLQRLQSDTRAALPADDAAMVRGAALLMLHCTHMLLLAGNKSTLPPASHSQVDYSLALGAQQFVGNSASAFSALLLLERWHRGSFAAYYNGGGIPLEAHVPLYR